MKKTNGAKIRFKYSQKEIIDFLKANTTTAILIAFVLLIITLGNSFVVGALMGGYLGANRAEKLYKHLSTGYLVLGASIGAVLGGTFLITVVTIGSFLHMIASLLAAVAGWIAIVAFSGDITENVMNRLKKFSFIGKDKNNIKTNKKKKSKPYKKKRSNKA
jgi:hypothetical protein